MAKKSVFEQIKKQNGEQFAKAIRAYDNGIFDIPNIVNIVKYAGRESESLRAYLISLKDIQIEENNTDKDPFDLLSEAGYNAYHADDLEKQNKISEYFEQDEMLCTFQDPERFDKYHIINAVKKNVKEINREAFRKKERREDAYGTSVISIQILKDGGFISIKNRYNHTIDNPDNTFNSNPDNIIKGLSASLKKHFRVDFSAQKVMLPNNFISINNQIIRYNYEINNIYFGRDFYVKDGHISSLDKNTEIMLDSCILNTKNRTLYDPSVCREPIYIDDITENSGTFMSVLALELKDKKIQIQKNKEGGHDIYANKDRIASVQEGKITALNLPNTTEIGDDFLFFNKSLQQLSLPNLKSVGDAFLERNNALRQLNLPNLESVRDSFLCRNNSLQQLSLSKLESVGDSFLYWSNSLQQLSLSKLESVGKSFLWCNNSLQQLDLPNLTTVGDNFLSHNTSLQQLSLPNLESAGCNFLYNNDSLQQLSLPNLESVGDNFLWFNNSLQQLDLPNLKSVGYSFLYNNNTLQQLDLPNLKSVGDRFLYNNNTLQQLSLPNLESAGCDFLYNNDTLQQLDLPNLESALWDFLSCNTSLQQLDLPKLEIVWDKFLSRNTSLQQLNLPSLKSVGDEFLCKNTSLQQLDLPNLKSVGEYFLQSNEALQQLNLPKPLSGEKNAESLKTTLKNAVIQPPQKPSNPTLPSPSTGNLPEKGGR